MTYNPQNPYHNPPQGQQHGPQQGPHHVTYVREVPPPSNGLGLAGFIVSLVSFVACGGILSPIGLLLSFFGLFKRPRGFAVAGFILGLIGSLWIIIFFAFIGLGAVAAAIDSTGAMDTNRINTNESIAYERGDRLVEFIDRFEDQTGLLPPSLEMANLTVTDLDPWDNRYRYTLLLDDQGLPDYTLTSDGPDGTPDTHDDLVIRAAGDAHPGWELNIGDDHDHDHASLGGDKHP